jgi:hypothetical protein
VRAVAVWLPGQSDTPRCSAMRLWRQERPGEWAPVFRRMADELAAATYVLRRFRLFGRRN